MLFQRVVLIPLLEVQIMVYTDRVIFVCFVKYTAYIFLIVFLLLGSGLTFLKYFVFQYLFTIQHFTVTWFTVASMTTLWTTTTTTSLKASITTKDLYVLFPPPLTAYEVEITDDKSIYDSSFLCFLSFLIRSGFGWSVTS